MQLVHLRQTIDEAIARKSKPETTYQIFLTSIQAIFLTKLVTKPLLIFLNHASPKNHLVRRILQPFS